ncbi:hypothetical protein EON67_01545, partial [archaeon]
MYAGECLRDNAEGVVSILSEAITQPKLLSWEVNESKDLVAEGVEAAHSNPLQHLMDGLHSSAFGYSSGLGHSLYPAAADLADVDADVLRQFLGARFTSKNMVVVGTS